MVDGAGRSVMGCFVSRQLKLNPNLMVPQSCSVLRESHNPAAEANLFTAKPQFRSWEIPFANWIENLFLSLPHRA
jgi:hypothetical protein